jgi:hypothetical protein
MLDEDGAAVVRAMVDDAAAIILADTSRRLTQLESTLGTAFATGADRAWRAAYATLERIVRQADDETSASVQRLRAFLLENDDLGLPTPIETGGRVGLLG